MQIRSETERLVASPAGTTSANGYELQSSATTERSPFVLPAMIDDVKNICPPQTAPGDAAGDVFAVNVMNFAVIPDPTIFSAPPLVVAVLPEIVELLMLPVP